jgi:regulator of replication initiation timing
LSVPLTAQTSETGGDSDDGMASAPGTVRAQPAGPDAAQDAEAARQKLLKASDQIDQMESNSEANKAALDGIKTQLAKLQDDNTALKSQVSTLQDTVQKQQDSLDRMQANRAKERQALIDEISALVAEKTGSHRVHHTEAETAPAETHDTADDSAPSPPPKRKKVDSLAPPPDTATSGPTNPAESAGADDSASTPATASTASNTPSAPSHPHKGYIYVVKAHETLSLIVGAFRDQGVKVTVAEVRKANGLTASSKLKIGQKLFIPKPGA